jgi:hypothetical protein
MLKPETAVESDEVTPPENVATYVLGILMMTTPEPPAAPTAAVANAAPPPPPPLFVAPDVIRVFCGEE